MGIDRKKKQQKKAQKVAKSKAKKVHHKKQLAIRGTGAPLALRGTLQSPVYQCWEPAQLFNRNRGIGSVVVTRKAQGHQILMAVFLLDVFCLGVKNAYIKLMSEEEYRFQLKQLRTHEGLRSTSPACARKLVEEAEAYARKLGLEPHKDYQAAKKIFGDIETADCRRSFEFGCDGKPLYIAGPYDSQVFQKRVLKTLTDKLGPEGFHFLTPLGVPPDALFE